MSLIVSPRLIRRILENYALEWDGLHGPAHWARVLEIGRRLARAEGVRRDVVELFAVFHDSRRRGEARDADHGVRGADFARQLRGTYFQLDDAGMRLLVAACQEHTDGLCQAAPTVSVCWDSDRLDLGRAGIEPDPIKLCTQAARDSETLTWAHFRSLRGIVPDLLGVEWNIASLERREWLE